MKNNSYEACKHNIKCTHTSSQPSIHGMEISGNPWWLNEATSLRLLHANGSSEVRVLCGLQETSQNLELSKEDGCMQKPNCLVLVFGTMSFMLILNVSLVLCESFTEILANIEASFSVNPPVVCKVSPTLDVFLV